MREIKDFTTSKETSHCLSYKLALSYSDLLVLYIMVHSHVTFAFVSILAVVSNFNIFHIILGDRQVSHQRWISGNM